MAKKSTAASAAASAKEGHSYCTLCWGESYEGTGKIDPMPLSKCRECHTLYHNECYRNYSIFAKEVVNKQGEKMELERDSSGTIVLDTCIACASVGKTIKGRTRRGKQHSLEIKTRPYDCCLCSVDSPDLPLPMHPIYDRNHGRQLILDADHQGKGTGLRLAWCHTLCARVIGSSPPTGGCVYSCDPRGEYAGLVDDDDDRSISSEIAAARADALDRSKEREYGVHHYCIVLQPAWKTYIKAIKTAQKFKCHECGIGEKFHGYRIPIACYCCDKHEPENYSACHSKADQEGECLKAMHVGCAMWGSRINGVQRFPPVRRLHFQPNTVGGNDFFAIYCDEHAQNIRKKGKQNKIDGYDWLRYPEHSGKIAAPSKRGIKSIPVVNDKDSIESEDEDDGYDGEEMVEDDDDEIEEDTETGGRGQSHKRKKKGGTVAGAKKGKRTSIPHKEETARERLERRMAKNKKIASGATTLTSHTGGGGHQTAAAKAATAATTNGNDDPLSNIQIPRKSSKAGAATEAAPRAQHVEPPKPKRKPASIKLKGLLDGSGVNWHPVQGTPEHLKKKNGPESAEKVAVSSAADAVSRAYSIPRKTSITDNNLSLLSQQPGTSAATIPNQSRLPPANGAATNSNIFKTGLDSDIELIATTMDDHPKVVPADSTVTIGGHAIGDDSDIDWGDDGGEQGEIKEVDNYHPPQHDDVPPWQNDEADASLEYILPHARPPTSSALVGSLPQSTSVEEGEIPDSGEGFYHVPAAAATGVEEMVAAARGTLQAELPHQEVVATGGGQTFTGDEKERSDKFFSQIMDEISLKRKYRLERNDLDVILDNVELHWQAELTRCGIQDAEAFFQIIRVQAQAENEADDHRLLVGASVMKKPDPAW